MSTTETAPGSRTATSSPTTPSPGPFERKELGEHTTAPWKIGVLSLCPARYYLGGIAKDPRRKESGFEAMVGTLLHHGIEQVAWMRTWLPFGTKEALTPEELLRGIDRETTNKSVEQARRNPEALAEARVLAKKIAPNVDLAGMIIESVGTKLRPLVEEPWTLDVGEVEGKRVVVGGIWDFVRRKKGRVVITDWKKGGDLRGTDELRLDPAATLYAAAAKARWPKEEVRVEHFYLTRGTSTGLNWTPEVDEWARMAALEFARASLAFERVGSWPATPSIRACSYCSFRPTCTAFRERVTRDFSLGAFDPAALGDIEKGTLARARAKEDAKLLERWVEDLDRALDPVVARAADAGQDEVIVAGHVLRRAKRTSHSFPLWRRTISRLWELTGIAPEETEDAVLSLQIGAVDQLLAARGYDKDQREHFLDVLKSETAEERSSTWIEVRPVADPMPTIDVEQTLRLGVRVALPPPAAPENTTARGETARGETARGETARGAQEAGPAPAAAAPAPTPEPTKATPAGPATTEPRPFSPPPSSQGASPEAPPVKVEPLDHATAAIALARQAENPELVSTIVTEQRPAAAATVGAFSCPCGRSFQNKRGQSGHQRTCPMAPKKEEPAP